MTVVYEKPTILITQDGISGNRANAFIDEMNAGVAATAADRVQTGLDRAASTSAGNAASTSAGNAATSETNAAAFAVAAATSATEAATSAADVVLYNPSFKDVATLLASTATFTAGTIIRTQAEGFAYQAVASGGHVRMNAGAGQRLNVLKGQDGYYALAAFGPAANGTTDDTAILTTALAVGPVDGWGLTYAVTEIVGAANMALRNITLKGTDSAKIPLKVGTVGGATYPNTNVSFKNIKITGVGSYAFVFSGSTQFVVDNIEVTGFTATNDVIYLNRLYAGVIGNIRVLGGTTCGSTNSCFNLALGINGITLNGIYTSAFTKYGVTIQGACNSITFNSPVLQGHSCAWNLIDCYGVTINSPYTENVVNPFIIGSGAYSPRAIKVQGGGFISAVVTGHTFSADDNKVLILANRGYAITFDNCNFPGVTSTSSGKRLASVNNDCVLDLINPVTAVGDLTESVTAILYKESTAAATAGFYIRDVGAIPSGGNTESTEVKRTNGASNGHVIVYYNSSNVLTSSTWSPPNNV